MDHINYLSTNLYKFMGVSLYRYSLLFINSANVTILNIFKAILKYTKFYPIYIYIYIYVIFYEIFTYTKLLNLN